MTRRTVVAREWTPPLSADALMIRIAPLFLVPLLVAQDRRRPIASRRR